MLVNSSHILQHYELNVFSIGKLHLSTTRTLDKQVSVVLMVSTDARIKVVQGSNPTDD